jgi:hypothetical protein
VTSRLLLCLRIGAPRRCDLAGGLRHDVHGVIGGVVLGEKVTAG